MAAQVDAVTPRSIFLAAIMLPDDQTRQAFVDLVCRDDESLKERVYLLLTAWQRNEASPIDAAVQVNTDETALSNADAANQSLDNQTPRQSASHAANLHLSTHRQIGPYKLLEQIGHGGMGAVYMAQQTVPVKRKVALKIIKPGMDSREVIARFEAERQALALMDHPNIAKVLDGGTTQEGRPYFVMELVRGVPLTDYCREKKAELAERLKLFIDVCRAVQHAHQKGIIHRDLKPSNILITLHDGVPVVKVIDFGVAKALNQELTERTLFTQFSQMIGTPLYMAPEQAEMSGLDIDTRSDVYSLGVVLYELLTGTTPFDKDTILKLGFDGFRKVLKEQEPPRPSVRLSTLKAADQSTLEKKRLLSTEELTRKLQRELDWIVMKALEKDRDRRYESATALAADVKRYLDNEPVLACPPTLAYRVQKLFVRHRFALLTSALFFVTFLIATAVSIRQAWIANIAKSEALRSNAIARQAVDDMYSQFAQKWLSEQGAASPFQQELLEKAIAFYESQAEASNHSAVYRLRNAKDRLRIADIHRKLGKLKEAESACAEVISQCQDAASGGPDEASFRIVLIDGHRSLGELSLKLDRAGDALQHALTAYKLMQGLITNDHLKDNEMARLASSAALLSELSERLVRQSEAERFVNVSLDLWSQLRQRSPANWDYRAGYAKALGVQGFQRTWNHFSVDEGKKSLTASAELCRELLLERPRDHGCRRLLAICNFNLGAIASEQQKLGDAITRYRDAVQILESLARDFPDDQTVQRDLSIALSSLSRNLLISGETMEGRHVLRQQQETCERLVQLSPAVFEFIQQYERAASIEILTLMNEGALLQAVSVAQRLIDRLENVKPHFESGRLEMLNRLQNLALLRMSVCLLDLQKPKEANAALEKIHADAFAFNHSQLKQTWDRFAKLKKHQFIVQAYYDQYAMRMYSLAQVQKSIRLLTEGLEGAGDPPDSLPKLHTLAQVLEQEVKRVWEDFEARFDGLQLGRDELASAATLCSHEAGIDRALIQYVGTASRASRLPFIRKIAQAFDQITSSDEASSIGFMTMELVAGDEELRDPQLALRLASRELELTPDSGLTRQNMAYAYFRNGKYQEAMDMWNEKLPLGDPTHAALAALCLWHLDRKEEGIEYLIGEYRQKLEKYCTSTEKLRKQGTFTWPSAEQLMNLDREAMELYGSASEFRDRLNALREPVQTGCRSFDLRQLLHLPGQFLHLFLQYRFRLRPISRNLVSRHFDG